ncbi:MAG TPA: sulfur oxidation c-type cytochrome SoxA [Acetobacteraceae bacterium]|nr:sulfur oxidation c-type cytochrome SoxA [Acetobacteraceae bacterium]
MKRALLLAAALLLGGAEKHSGYEDATEAVRAMQDDDTANPAMLWVEQGAALWNQGTKSCASCHGPPASMRGVAARYPRFAGRPITLAAQVNQCRTERQGLPALPEEGDEMLGLTALIGMQSRGLPVAVDASGPAAQATLEQGRALFEQRMGQLNLACAQCHDGLAGMRLGGSRIPQGHPNGYPEYRLEWQGMGSLYRRLRNCMVGVRADPLPPGSPEVAALEFYLGWRANGLKVETPAVRP